MANEIRLYIDQPGTVLTATFNNAYVSPGAGRTTIGGLNDGTLVATVAGINGLVGGNAVPTAPQIAQWFADLKSGLATPAIAGITTRRWVANDYISPDEFQVTAPTPIVDEVANVPLPLAAPASTNVKITNYGAVFFY